MTHSGNYELAASMASKVGTHEGCGLIYALLAIVDVLEDIRDDARNRDKSKWLDSQ